MAPTARVKRCSRCGVEKPWDSFNKNKREKFGVRNECRDCQKTYSALPHVKAARELATKAWRSKPENRERKNELERERRSDPEVKSKISAYGKEYQAKPHVKARRKEWAHRYNAQPDVKERVLELRQKRLARGGAREAHNAKVRIYIQTPKARARRKEYDARPEVKERKKLSAAQPHLLEKRQVSQAEYRRRPEVRRKRTQWTVEKYTSDLLFRLQAQLRSRTKIAVKRGAKSGSSVLDLGCSIEDFKKHIESQFTGEMSWDNHGTLWHLDHIIPLSAADLTVRDQFLLVAHYENYQPLLISENLSKNDQLPKEGERGWERYQQLLALQAKQKAFIA